MCDIIHFISSITHNSVIHLATLSVMFEYFTKHFHCEISFYKKSVYFCLQDKSGFNMFSSTAYGGGTVLFSESSSMFQQAGSEDPKKWMGPYYYNALSAMDCTMTGETY